MLIKSFVVIFLLTAALAPASLASGTNSYTPPNQQEWQDLRDPYREAYDSGRRTLKRDVTCKKCAFPEGVKDRETALAVLGKIHSGEITLTEEKTVALVYYLDKRFKLRTEN